MDIHGHPRISMDVDAMDIHGYPRISTDINGYPWITMYIHGYPRISMDIRGCHGCPWLSMDIRGCPWISMDIHVYPCFYRTKSTGPYLGENESTNFPGLTFEFFRFPIIEICYSCKTFLKNTLVRYRVINTRRTRNNN